MDGSSNLTKTRKINRSPRPSVPFSDADLIVVELNDKLGESLRRICEEIGVHENSYYGWRKNGQIPLLVYKALLGLKNSMLLDDRAERRKLDLTKDDLRWCLNSAILAGVKPLAAKLAAACIDAMPDQGK